MGVCMYIYIYIYIYIHREREREREVFHLIANGPGVLHLVGADVVVVEDVVAGGHAFLHAT